MKCMDQIFDQILIELHWLNEMKSNSWTFLFCFFIVVYFCCQIEVNMKDIYRNNITNQSFINAKSVSNQSIINTKSTQNEMKQFDINTKLIRN